MDRNTDGHFGGLTEVFNGRRMKKYTNSETNGQIDWMQTDKLINMPFDRGAGKMDG